MTPGSLVEGEAPAPSMVRGGAGRGRKALGVFLTIGIAWAFLGLLALHAARNTLLAADTYTSALADNRVYDRVYDELLADPDLFDTHAQLAGELKIPPDEAAAAIRQAFPPEYLRSEVEGAITAVTAYLRGETDELNVVIHFGPILKSIPEAATAAMGRQIDHAQLVPVNTDAEFIAGLGAALENLRDGQPPATLPSLFPLTPAQQATYTAMIFPPNRALPDTPEIVALHTSVAEMLNAGDTREALKLAVKILIGPLFTDAISGLREHLDTNDNFNLVDQLAKENDETPEEFLDQFSTVRDVTSGTAGWGYFAALGVVLLLAAALSGLFAPEPVAMLTWPGRALAIAGSIGVILHVFLRFLLRWAADQFDPSTTDGPPEAAQTIGIDIARTLIRNAGSSLLLPSIIVTVAGAALIGLGVYVRIQGRPAPA